MVDLIWLIPIFPLIGAALMLLIGKRLPKAGVNAVCVGSVFLSFALSVGAVVESHGSTHEVVLFHTLDAAERRQDPIERKTERCAEVLRVVVVECRSALDLEVETARVTGIVADVGEQQHAEVDAPLRGQHEQTHPPP